MMVFRSWLGRRFAAPVASLRGPQVGGLPPPWHRYGGPIENLCSVEGGMNFGPWLFDMLVSCDSFPF